MRYRRLRILVFAALLAALTAIHCLPTEAKADRRRRWTTYGSARDRLVVACDMRSSTCSDGRRIATTRATPVPCETSPGVWEMVPEDTACISWRGLEVWAATTSYLSYGAELDRSPWRAVEGASIDGRILTGPAGSARLLQGIPPSAGTWTLACRMRALSGNSTRLRVYQSGGTGGSFASKYVGLEWATVFHTWEIGGEPTELSVHIYPDGSTLEIAGCWLTRTATPGRACWGGEAPVTCAADRHTISTEGWPTEAGEIAVSFEVGAPEGSARYIIDGRATGATTHSILLIESTGRLRLDLKAGTPNHGPDVPPGKHHVRLRWGDGRTQVFLNGSKVIDSEGTPTWMETAHLGARYSGVEHINGSISSLRIRSFE